MHMYIYAHINSYINKFIHGKYTKLNKYKKFSPRQSIVILNPGLGVGLGLHYSYR